MDNYIEFLIPTKIHLREEQIEEARKFLNLEFLGDEECNVIQDGKLVSKYPEKESPLFQSLHSEIRRAITVLIKVRVDRNGVYARSLSNERL